MAGAKGSTQAGWRAGTIIGLVVAAVLAALAFTTVAQRPTDVGSARPPSASASVSPGPNDIVFRLEWPAQYHGVAIPYNRIQIKYLVGPTKVGTHFVQPHIGNPAQSKVEGDRVIWEHVEHGYRNNGADLSLHIIDAPYARVSCAIISSSEQNRDSYPYGTIECALRGGG